MDSRRLEILLAAVVMGESPESVDLADDERELWERLKREVADIQAAGGVVDIPSEIPDFWTSGLRYRPDS